MALIEIELLREQFTNLILYVLTTSRLPTPTLALLGASRLLSKPFTWGLPILDATVPGYNPPPGTLVVQAPVTITHISLDELKADAHAVHATTDCTAWLLVSTVTDNRDINPWRIEISLLRLEAAGLPAQVFAPPLFIGRQFLPLKGVDDVRASAVFFQGDVGTLRVSIGGDDNLLVPPLNLLSQDEDNNNWLIRISGEVFADRVRRQLGDALQPPPDNTKIEAGPSAQWTPMPGLELLTASHLGDSPGGVIDPVDLEKEPWGVIGSVDLEKENACADVDVSVSVGVLLAISPDLGAGKLNLGLRISSDVSDWDVFRCWVTAGLLTSLLTGVVSGFTGGLLSALEALISLIYIADNARSGAGEEVVNTQVGGGFTKMSGDDTSAWYEKQLDLPAIPTGTINEAKAGPDGLLTRGRSNIIALDHTITFEPEAGPLDGYWAGHYQCGRGWKTGYEVNSIVVRDVIYDLSTNKAIQGNGVVIFPTTTFLRSGTLWESQGSLNPGGWDYEAPATVTASPSITPYRSTPPRTGEAVMFFLHTSAGLRRYDIGPVPAIPQNLAKPSPTFISAYEINCKRLVRQWTRLEQLGWLVDPPPFDYGQRPLRQWMLTLRELNPMASLTVHTRNGHVERASHHTFGGAESGFIEIVTDAHAELAIDHNLQDSEAEVRVLQRWLLPTQSVRLPGKAEALELMRLSNGIAVPAAVVDGRWFALRDEGLIEVTAPIHRRTMARRMPTRSLTLPGGQVAVLWNDHLIKAVPRGPHQRADTRGRAPARS